MTYHSGLFNLLPESILTKSPDSTNAKMWHLFSSQMDELESVLESIRLVREIDSMEGKVLDLIGEIVRENRDGKDDATYRIYLAIAIRRAQNDCSIENLNDIIRLILGSYYIGIIDHSSWVNHGETLFLDGTWYLDGGYLLSGSSFQFAHFEIRIKVDSSPSLKIYLETILPFIKGAGIAFHIREVS